MVFHGSSRNIVHRQYSPILLTVIEFDFFILVINNQNIIIIFPALLLEFTSNELYLVLVNFEYLLIAVRRCKWIIFVFLTNHLSGLCQSNINSLKPKDRIMKFELWSSRIFRNELWEIEPFYYFACSNVTSWLKSWKFSFSAMCTNNYPPNFMLPQSP